MNRRSYDAAFEIMRAQESVANALENIGLRFEYEDGVVGKAFNTFLNSADTIIIESLGLHERTEATTCTISGERYPITLERLYTEENNPDWSITADDMCEFFYQARDNETLQDLMWKAMVEKNEDAKKELNATMKSARIGCICKNKEN